MTTLNINYLLIASYMYVSHEIHNNDCIFDETPSHPPPLTAVGQFSRKHFKRIILISGDKKNFTL